MKKHFSLTSRFDNKVEQVNPEFSKVKAYICYTGLNRNNSNISKETLENAIPSLFNIPVVGEWIKENDNFGSHGGKIEISDKGVKYIPTTKAYGVVPSDSEITWETVIEDGVEKEYLTCSAYLWTSRYPESLKAIEDGVNQSMEISCSKYNFDQDNVCNIEEMTFSALCMLGKSDDPNINVEPCFESSRIESYSLDNFKSEFAEMIEELKFSLSNKEGGSNVENETENFEVETQEETVEVVEETIEPVISEYEVEETVETEINPAEKFELDTVSVRRKLNELIELEEKNSWGCWVNALYQTYFVYENYSDDKYYKMNYSINGNEVSIDTTTKIEVVAQFITLAERDAIDEMRNQNFELQEELNTLREFKADIERQEKLNKLDEFASSVGEDELNAIRENIDTYSLDQIEKEVAYVMFKNQKFNLNKKETKKDTVLKFEKQEATKTPKYGDLEIYFNKKLK